METSAFLYGHLLECMTQFWRLYHVLHPPNMIMETIIEFTGTTYVRHWFLVYFLYAQIWRAVLGSNRRLYYKFWDTETDNVDNTYTKTFLVCNIKHRIIACDPQFVMTWHERHPDGSTRFAFIIACRPIHDFVFVVVLSPTHAWSPPLLVRNRRRPNRLASAFWDRERVSFPVLIRGISILRARRARRV